MEFFFPSWHQECYAFFNITCPSLQHQLGIIQFISILTSPGVSTDAICLRFQSHKMASLKIILASIGFWFHTCSCMTWLLSQEFHNYFLNFIDSIEQFTEIKQSYMNNRRFLKMIKMDNQIKWYMIECQKRCENKALSLWSWVMPYPCHVYLYRSADNTDSIFGPLVVLFTSVGVKYSGPPHYNTKNHMQG